MPRLSEEFLEDIVRAEKTAQRVQTRIDSELRLLVEEIAKRCTR